MKKILIVIADYYSDISKSLKNSAVKEFSKNKYSLKIIRVPGVFEIPVTISKYIKKYDGFVVLGCVIKGQTPHFNFITNATFNSIQNLSITYKKPIGNGIITCLNYKQAIARANPKNKDKGGEAAKAIISVLSVK